MGRGPAGTAVEVAGLRIQEASLPGVRILTPRRFEDERGFLSETWSRERLRAAGIDLEFVQENHSFSERPGTIRGFHFQAPPFEQHKLIRVVQGSVLDVALDIRIGSPTYGRWTAVLVSAQRWNQILVPAGFAHAFCTLEPDTHVLYKVTAPYAPDSEAGVRWDDPELAVEWPEMDAYHISDRDRAQPRLSELVSPFRDTHGVA